VFACEWDILQKFGFQGASPPWLWGGVDYLHSSSGYGMPPCQI